MKTARDARTPYEKGADHRKAMLESSELYSSLTLVSTRCSDPVGGDNAGGWRKALIEAQRDG